MTRSTLRVQLFAAALLWFVVPSDLRASDSPCEVKCTPLYDQSPPKWRDGLTESEASIREEGAKMLNACLMDLREPSTSMDDRQLVELRNRHVHLKKWVGALTKGGDADANTKHLAATTRTDAARIAACVPRITQPESGDAANLAEAKKELQEFRERLHDVMDTRGLRQPVAAELLSGFAFADVEGVGSGDTQQSTFLHFASKHAGATYDEDRNFDFSIGGRLGLQPALTLVKSEAVGGADSAAPAVTQTRHQQAFVMSVRPQVNLHCFNDSTELSLFGTAGLMRLMQSAEQSADGRTVLIPVGNDGGRSSRFFEAGARVQIGASRELVHEQKDSDAPLEFGFGYRRDLRFKKDADLVAFESPQDRLVARVALNNLLVWDRTDPERVKTFNLTLGIEHEWAIKKGGIPSATRIFLRSDVNLDKLLGKGGAKSETEE